MWTWVRGRLAGGATPARLRSFASATVVIAVAFALLGAYGVDRRAGAIDQAAESADQLLLAQDVEVRILRADALASENFLRGGLEDPTVRQAFVAELAAAGEGLIAVSNRAPSSVLVPLRAAATAIARYSGLVEQARANNRQGFPVGVTYLLNANRVLGDEVLPALREVQQSLRDEVNGQLDRADRSGVWFHVSGWLAVALLAVGAVWMARRFRRVLNLPIAAALVVLVVVMVAGGKVQGASITDAERATATTLQTADLTAQARSAAFRARTQEAMALIQRGNGATADAAWADADGDSRVALEALCTRHQNCQLATSYIAYQRAYREVRTTDIVDGDWEEAVRLSLVRSAASFSGFDQDSAVVADESAAAAAASLSGATDGLGLLTSLVFAVGLLAAGLAVVGYGQRLKEYR